MISMSLANEIDAACGDWSTGTTGVACSRAVSKMYSQSGSYNTYNLLDTCGRDSNPKPVDMEELRRVQKLGGTSARTHARTLMRTRTLTLALTLTITLTRPLSCSLAFSRPLTLSPSPSLSSSGTGVTYDFKDSLRSHPSLTEILEGASASTTEASRKLSTGGDYTGDTAWNGVGYPCGNE